MKNVANLIVFSTLIAFASTAVLEGKSRNNLIDERNVLSDEGKACIPESYGPCTSNSDCCQDETDWAGEKAGLLHSLFPDKVHDHEAVPV